MEPVSGQPPVSQTDNTQLSIKPKSLFQRLVSFFKNLGNSAISGASLQNRVFRKKSEKGSKTSEVGISVLGQNGSLNKKTSSVSRRALDPVPPLSADKSDAALRAYDNGLPFGDGAIIEQTYTEGDEQYIESAERHDLDVLTRASGTDEEGKLSQLAELYKGKSFLSSNYFRGLIADQGFMQACKNYLVAPVNMRTQKLVKKDSVSPECQFMRMGAITDLRNGFTNLKELKQMANDPLLKLKKMEDLKARLPKAKNQNQKEAIERAIQELNNPVAAATERREVLQEVFLEMLQQQVLNKGIDSDHFSLIQVSLLNPTKSHLDRTGWMHDENNAMLDMAEIYKELNGKSLVFGQGGPKIEGDIIYLPVKPAGANEDPVRLSAIFFNFSVQGHTKNDGSQKQVNSEAAQALSVLSKDQRDPDLLALKDILEGKNSDYSSAEMASMIALRKGALVINCASGKDRTGALSARLILRHLPPEIYVKQKDHIFDRDSFAARIVRDNTGISVLKVDPRAIFFFPGISTAAKARFLWGQIQVFLFKGKPEV